jgi:hypothetical protein
MFTLAVPVLPLQAADQAPIVRSGQVYERPVYCGPCGCVYVTYDRHRQLRSTYGVGFDPRNYDETQPHYYFGPLHSYAHYWTDNGAVEGPHC